MGLKNTFCLVLLFVALITKEALAAQLLVGGSQGWETTTDLDSWASGQTFKVGDQLVFKYSSGLHSVVELANEDAYKNCDLGTSLDSKNTGNDVLKLNKPGTRYFACGTLGHCSEGMKVKIKVVAGNASSSPASSSSSPPSSSSSSPSSTTSTSAASTSCSFAAIFVLLASSFLATIVLSMY
ncbi:hypothetical protein UlMin_013786 [Ulmus minor]